MQAIIPMEEFQRAAGAMREIVPVIFLNPTRLVLSPLHEPQGTQRRLRRQAARRERCCQHQAAAPERGADQGHRGRSKRLAQHDQRHQTRLDVEVR